MIFCVDAKPGDVRQVLAERGIDPYYVEWDDGSKITEIGVDTVDAEAMLRDLQRVGWRVFRGHAHTPHPDPTAAKAAQRILRREHRRAA